MAKTNLTDENKIVTSKTKKNKEKAINKSKVTIDKPEKAAMMFNAAAAVNKCPDNKFTYSFDNDQCTILSFIVEGFEIDAPVPDKGSFTTCLNDLNDPQQIRVIVIATEDSPGGRSALTLKFLGKDVFDPPTELLQKNGFLKISTIINLPA